MSEQRLTIPQALATAQAQLARGNTAQAEALLRQIVAAEPANDLALHLLGLAVLASGRADEAADLLARAAARNPSPECYANLGHALTVAGRATEAISACRTAVSLRPEFVDGHINLGNALRAALDLRGAADAYRAALAIAPDAAAYNNMGNVLKDLGEHAAAVAALREAVRLAPQMTGLQRHLADALAAAGDATGAVAAYEADVALCARQKNNALQIQALNNLAGLLKDLRQTDRAVAAYEAALQLETDPARAATIASNRLLALLYHRGDDGPAVFEEHARWGQQFANTAAARHPSPEAFPNTRDPKRQLRIGYVSPDFADHPVAALMEPVLAANANEQFQIVCYRDVPRLDDVGRRLQAVNDSIIWRDIWGWSDDRLAAQIRDDRIDILVDLAGHTANNRLLLFAQRPAPLAVTALGYPATTGAPGIDYRLTDSLSDPPGSSDAWHSERLIRLDPVFLCYQPPADVPEPAPLLRGDGRVTFGSFNKMEKVSPATISLWAAVLRAVPQSRLLIKGRYLEVPRIAEALRDDLAGRGVSGDRIEVVRRTSTPSGHLAAYGRVDIALDAFPYHGTLTTLDALWMGVPVISLTGRTHVSRVGKSLLTAVGLPELAADTREQYVTAAVKLASDATALQQLKATLRARMRQSPLVDAKAFTQRLGSAYRTIWTRWREQGV